MSTPDDAARERYQRVADRFHDALDLPPDDRPTFLDRLRRDDEALAAEVESLLAAHERAADFIERPALASLAMDSGLPALPQTSIGHYRLLGVVGQGGMGVVYLAEDTRLGRTVALKAVRPEHGADTTQKARLRREARAAAALVHPRIATVYALEEIDDRLYVASEFVPGETLRAGLSRGPLAPERAWHVALSILDALDAASQRGIVHRDLKPENVMTTPEGEVKVLDFGLAHFADGRTDQEPLTRDGMALGTPAYMSPEQIRGEPVDGRSDLFAWGVLVVELVTGRHPFLGPTPAATIARVLESPAPAVLAEARAHARGADTDRLLEWAERCLAKTPASRPASAGEVLVALRDARARGAARVTSPAPSSAGYRPAPVSARRAVWWWQFHQVATTVAYGLLLVPLWRTRAAASASWGRTLFLVALVAVVVSVMLRMHLWFARREYPGEWATDHRAARLVARLADSVFAAALGLHGAMLVSVDDPTATVLVAAAASVLVSFAIIEPATTRAMATDDRPTD